ncbi:MAG: DNA mismatch repair endonuclease MutL [Spirochaetaceae bacterium]|jgi:DNA mismatch repair protein MutL|nr:DNA mismatch repair endonuclease MutL [Spirochaetaceae bacterium]
MNQTMNGRPVRLLPPELARKIAAGEVIDRPQAVLREFLDNAVDAGALNIIVEIDGGGIDRIRVADDGAGMSKTDLEQAARPHATSKIAEEEDLQRIMTLGFRGEALASIAAVSRLAITSVRSGEQAWQMRASITEDHLIQPASLSKGTVCVSEALFENIPARRHFLNRPTSEGILCRQMFAEKALPMPHIAFRLIMDGKTRLALPAGQTLAERWIAAFLPDLDPRLFTELHAQDGVQADNSAFYRATVVIGDPSVRRTDRKYIHIYVNGHRINEFALLQALEYGAEGYFPNGTHPVAALFFTVAPDLVDFNIHPAKREARFRDITPVRHMVIAVVREHLYGRSMSGLARMAAEGSQTETRGRESSFYQDSFRTPQKIPGGETGSIEKPPGRQAGLRESLDTEYSAAISASKLPPDFRDALPQRSAKREVKMPAPSPGSDFLGQYAAETGPAYRADGLRYIGSAFGVYLIVEKGDVLYLIDQHAAHERILYDRFMETAGQKQPLLVPYVVETSSVKDDAYLESIRDALSGAGFEAEHSGDGRWEFRAVPAAWQGSEDDLRQDLLENHIDPGDMLRSLAARTACRAAIKGGDAPDKDTAAKLAADVLALADPHCPHGRPLWVRISREELDRGVRRIE